MDTNLYQAISLGLMGLAVVLLLALMITLGKLRTLLEEDHASSRRAGAQLAAPAVSEPVGEASPQPGYAGSTATTGAQAAPAQRAPAEPAGAQQPAPAATAGVQPAAAPEPEEQPFERDGRWWYRRGDELLVYDEQTGQWKPAPEAELVGGAPPATQAPAAAVAPAQTQGDAFWKCPSCGAVNGSTATTCRMCFTARP